jgi:hypothetical protein
MFPRDCAASPKRACAYVCLAGTLASARGSARAWQAPVPAHHIVGVGATQRRAKQHPYEIERGMLCEVLHIAEAA